MRFERLVPGTWSAALLAGAVLGACSSSSSGSGGTQGDGGGPHVCVPGASIACTGPAGCSGGQACKSDGSGYDACVCGGAEAGAQDAAQDATGGGQDGGPEASGGASYKGVLSASKYSATDFLVGGDFYLVPDGGISTACPGTLVGSCCYTPPVSPDAGGGINLSLASAGSLTLKDGTTVLSMISPNSNLMYGDASGSNPMLTWMAGDLLSFAASGNTVHAFSIQARAPDDIGGTMPSIQGMIAVSTSMPFTLSWTAGSMAGATMNLELYDNTTTGYVDCTAMDSAGTLTVPVALFGNFSPMDIGGATLTRSSPAASASADNAVIDLAVTTAIGGSVTYQ